MWDRAAPAVVEDLVGRPVRGFRFPPTGVVVAVVFVLLKSALSGSAEALATTRAIPYWWLIYPMHCTVVCVADIRTGR